MNVKLNCNILIKIYIKFLYKLFYINCIKNKIAAVCRIITNNFNNIY